MPSWRRHSRWLVVVAVVAGAVGCAALILGRQSAAGSVSPLPVPKRSLLVYSTPNSTPPGGSPPAVYRAAPNGQRAVRLTAGRDPMLSPDGRWIDFRRGDGTNDRLFVINSAGGRPRDLGTKTDDDAVWSCNSRLIVAARYERASVVDIRDGSVRTFKVPVASGGYTFAPDGRSFALSRATARGATSSPCAWRTAESGH